MTRWGRLFEGGLIFFLAAGLAVYSGHRAAGTGQVNWDGLSAVAHARDIWYRAPEPRLSQIGFVEPPFPALVAAVVAAARGDADLVRFLPVRLGALYLGLTALFFFRLARGWRLSRLWAYPLTAALVLHPVLLRRRTGSPPRTTFSRGSVGARRVGRQWFPARPAHRERPLGRRGAHALRVCPVGRAHRGGGRRDQRAPWRVHPGRGNRPDLGENVRGSHDLR